MNSSRRPAKAASAAGVLLISLSIVTTELTVAPAAAVGVSSAVTVSGTGEFSSLKVTVSQTKQLVDQVVHVSWTGGDPTVPSSGSFARNYLQIMQCWGGADGPDREQCQFGGLTSDSRGGLFAASRQVSYGKTLVDPAETYQQPDDNTPATVPFRSVTGATVEGDRNQFFDQNTTNEIPFGRTTSDGTGQEFFEVQTAREAPGLGCGERLSGQVEAGRPCWLVVVPRGDTEVDGKPVDQSDFHQITSSPLSATNWARRIQVPLSFQPLGVSCPIGSAERRTLGQETANEAVTRWQPQLCDATGSIYGFDQVSDELSRRQLLSDDPQLTFIGRPVSSDAVVDRRPIVYAPVLLAGLSIAFDIERQSGYGASEDVVAHDGQRVPSLNLTPRLVAKLLTQSYKFGSSVFNPALKSNPADLTKDPDFLALNPSFKPLAYPSGIADILVPYGSSDATRELWAWIDGDKAAHTWLAGKADPWGMIVNPTYMRLSLPREDFPKSDPFCQRFDTAQAPLCTLDAHPYASDMHAAGRAAARGDTLSRSFWDLGANPPQYKAAPLEPSGQRGVLAITDTATAARFGLATASLQNAAGRFVAPTTTSLAAGFHAMRPSGVAGVGVPDPRSRAAAAYPLTTVTYAAVAPTRNDTATRKAYSALIRYAAGPGQQPGVGPGDLPAGYVPLPAAARQVASAAARRVLSATAPDPAADGSEGTPSDRPGERPSGALSRPTDGGPGVGPATAQTPGSPEATQPPAVAARRVSGGVTPADPVGAAHLALLVVLIVGAACIACGPALALRAPRARRR